MRQITIWEPRFPFSSEQINDPRPQPRLEFYPDGEIKFSTGRSCYTISRDQADNAMAQWATPVEPSKEDTRRARWQRTAASLASTSRTAQTNPGFWQSQSAYWYRLARGETV